MQTTKKVANGDIIYSINEKDKTASVVGYKYYTYDKPYFYIRSIIKISSEYYKVTSIAKNAFKFCDASTIEISEYASIQSIESDSFFEAQFKLLKIPSSIMNFDKNWNDSIYFLKKIEVVKTDIENIKVIEDKYLVGKTDLNSDIFDVLLFAFRDIREATIPSFIKIIASRAFQFCHYLYKIKLAPNSHLQKICSYAFSGSSIEEVEIPSNIQDLQDGWCYGANLKNIKVIKNGDENIKIVRNKFLVGKSDPKRDIFDMLLFVRHDIKKAKIPAYIKTIASCAFNFNGTHKVIFPKNSKIQTISESAFIYSLINEIKIPSQIKEINDQSFNGCRELHKITFSNDSKLKIIGEDAFSNSSIKYLEIPSSVSCFDKNWCSQTSNLTKIKIIKNDEENIKLIDNKYVIGKTDMKSDIFDIILFACRDIKEIVIPSFIKRIGYGAFCDCKMLKKVEFEPNSELQIISDDAFKYSAIENIDLPSSLIEFDESAFFGCKNLTKLTFSKNSKFEKFGEDAFSHTRMEEIVIPSNVKVINKNAFSHSPLKKITFQENSQLKIIEKNAFPYTLKYLEIPSNVMELGKEWICCRNMNEIKVINNGPENIKFINDFLIGKSDIKSDVFDVFYFALRKSKNVTIPAQIKKICRRAFDECNDLEFIDFDENSQLQIIEKLAFFYLSIKCICIPPKVTKIEAYAFQCCENLKMIEISRSTFNANEQNLLFDIDNAIFMVYN